MPETKAFFLPDQVGQMTHSIVEWTAIEFVVLTPGQSCCKADGKPIETEFALDI